MELYSRDFAQAAILHSLIEDQVKRTPDSIAVVFGSDQLTYRDLNQQANQLARQLVKMGVGPEKLVGICVERSLEMVVDSSRNIESWRSLRAARSSIPGGSFVFHAQQLLSGSVLLSQVHLLTTSSTE